MRGTLYIDRNDNHLRDAGEPPMRGIKVTVAGVSGITRSDGSYVLSNVPAGTHFMQADVFARDCADRSDDVFVRPVRTTIGNAVAVPLHRATFIVYNDLNGNGSRDDGEPLMSNFSTTYRLYTPSSELAEEGVIRTNASGRADLRLGFGRKSVFLSAPAGMRSAGSGDFFVAIDTTPDGHTRHYVGFTSVSDIFGQVWIDNNGDGSFNDDPPLGEMPSPSAGLGGWRVYIDQNNDGVWQPDEPSAVTDANGAYRINSVPAGAPIVRLIWSDETLSGLTRSGYRIHLGRGETQVANFRLARADASLRASVFSDLDGDNFRDPGEPSVGGIRVWIDADDDGVLDAGETVATTDADGVASFSNLLPGRYILRAVDPLAPVGGVPRKTLVNLLMSQSGTVRMPLHG